MDTPDVAQQLQAIRNQLDHITAEMDLANRRRREIDELKDDLTLIAKDAFNSAVVELEDIAPFVNTGDFLYLIKKILRNTSNITGLIHKLESAVDFVEDGKPIGKELFNDILLKMDELDRAGYFQFFSETFRVLDNIVTSFTIEDIQQLADNVVTILNTVKKLTQPDMLKVMDNAVEVFRNLNVEGVEEYSIWKAARELNTPEMKRGLGFLISFLKNVSKNQVIEKQE